MPFVKARNNESFESLIRRFKRSVERDDVLSELRKRECFEKPSVHRKRAKAAAIKRSQRARDEFLKSRKRDF